MISVIKEIEKLRLNKEYSIDRSNTNRYSVVINESDGSKTYYCFSSPIYNYKTGKLIDLKFKNDGNEVLYVCSGGEIRIGEQINFQGRDGTFSISLPGKLVKKGDKVLCFNTKYGIMEICPTLNGVLVKAPYLPGRNIEFGLRTSSKHIGARVNNRCFSLMKKRFKPLVNISTVGISDDSGNIISPLELKYQKQSSNEFMFFVSAENKAGKYVVFEIDMHESKLFQDTTVESKNAKMNNAFGPVAFIGRTKSYGEQWLYSKFDFGLLPEVIATKIKKVIIHIPHCNKTNAEFSAFRVASRFCSFGSNWINKIPSNMFICDSNHEQEFYSVDVMHLLADTEGLLTVNHGLILKPKLKNDGFAVISTGDSCYAPMILEMNIRM